MKARTGAQWLAGLGVALVALGERLLARAGGRPVAARRRELALAPSRAGGRGVGRRRRRG